jgi:hypothetical protein
MADQINQGGAKIQERQDPRQTGSNAASSRGAQSDDITQGNEAQHRREQMSKMEKAEGEMPRAFPDRDPALKKTGEF